MKNSPKSLQEAIQTQQLIPIVGAGVSMLIKNKLDKQVFPSWHELLERTAIF